MTGASDTPPPQSSPSGGEEVVIDDRRRFKELWKELLFARVGAAVVVAILVMAAAQLAWDLICELPRWLELIAAFVAISTALGAPTFAAKRGVMALPIVGGAFLLGIVVTVTFARLIAPWEPIQAATVATVGAAIGVAEGLLERSIATTYCGLAGGTLAGFATMKIIQLWPPGATPGPEPHDYALLALAAVTFQGCIGLSLALGRWIRDWPKRRREGEAGSAGAG